MRIIDIQDAILDARIKALVYTGVEAEVELVSFVQEIKSLRTEIDSLTNGSITPDMVGYGQETVDYTVNSLKERIHSCQEYIAKQQAILELVNYRLEDLQK